MNFIVRICGKPALDDDLVVRAISNQFDAVCKHPRAPDDDFGHKLAVGAWIAAPDRVFSAFDDLLVNVG